MIVVKDASGTGSYEKVIVLLFDGMRSVNNISSSNIKVYPNPTDGNLIIDLGDELLRSNEVTMKIYDCFGRLIQTEVISKFDNDLKAIISLKKLVPGTYFARCNEHYFKVVKK